MKVRLLRNYDPIKDNFTYTVETFENTTHGWVVIRTLEFEDSARELYERMIKHGRHVVTTVMEEKDSV